MVEAHVQEGELEVKINSPCRIIALPNAAKVSTKKILGSQIALWHAVSGVVKDGGTPTDHAAPVEHGSNR